MPIYRRWPVSCLALSLVCGPLQTLDIEDAAWFAAATIGGLVMLNLLACRHAEDTETGSDGRPD